jgi:hypothetical protein
MHSSSASQNSNLAPRLQGRLVQIAEVNFICSQYGSLYELVKAKALSDASERRIACPTCSGALPVREAQFALNYFLWRKSEREWHRTALSG